MSTLMRKAAAATAAKEDLNVRATAAAYALGVPISMRQAAVELIESHCERIKELIGGNYILLGTSLARGLETTLAE
jgi:hypothetical protein